MAASGALAVFCCLYFSGSAFSKAETLYINEVAFKESDDFIELKVSAEGNYAGYTLYEGGVKVATLPDQMYAEGQLILVNAGDALRTEADLQTLQLFDMGGLTGTDNIVQLRNANNEPIDAVLWSNNNAAFTGNKTEANAVLGRELWHSTELFSETFDQDAWTDSDSIKAGKSLQRASGSTGVSAESYEVVDATPGYEVVPNMPPTALFEVSGTHEVGKDITFDASGSLDTEGEIQSYMWEIDGEEIAYDAIFTHSFVTAGTYTVVLHVEDMDGATDSYEKQLTISKKVFDHRIQVTELFPNPAGSDSDQEYIELYNPLDVAFQLEGYALSDGSRTFTFSEYRMLPHEYLVLKRSETGIALNNTTDEIRFFDPNDELFFQVSYSSAREEHSFSLFDNQYIWTVPTPGAKNEIPEDGADAVVEEDTGAPDEDVDAVVESDSESQGGVMDTDADYRNVSISEFLPNPEGRDEDGEWIELHNYGNETLSLDGWELDDELGGSKPYSLDGKEVAPGAYVVIRRRDSGIQLNNTVDSVRLLNPYSIEVDAVRYTDVPGEGYAFARNEKQVWNWTLEPTPSAKNRIITKPVAAKKQSAPNTKATTTSKKTSNTKENASLQPIKSIKELDTGKYVKARGVVSVAPGMISKRLMIIEDETGPIQVYKSKDDVPDVELGNYVEVVGKTSQSKGEKRLLLGAVDDLIVLEPQADIPVRELSAGEINQLYENTIVSLSGVVAKREGNMLFLEDETGVARIYFTQGSTLSAQEYSEGDQLSARGVVRMRDERYVVHPRFEKDVEVAPRLLDGANEEAPEDTSREEVLESSSSPSQMLIYISFALGILLLAGAVYAYRKK